MSEPKKRGGARPGAGRPRKTDADKTRYVTISASVTPEQREILLGIADREQTTIYELILRALRRAYRL